MRHISVSFLLTLVIVSLSSCGDFMSGMAAGLAGIGQGGGYYGVPAVSTSAGFNTFPETTSFVAPANAFTTPVATTYIAPAATYSSGTISSSSSSSSSSS